MRKRWEFKKPVAIATSIALAFSLTVAPGVASARSANDRLFAGTMAASDVPEWAIDDGVDEGATKLGAQAALPTKYDLRDDGLVTPVKSQSPGQNCWAFAGIAAAEASMLSAYGSTYAESKLDLSERHLAWYALHPVTDIDDPEQAGEGLNTISQAPNAAFDTGGMPAYITTLFAQGVGPHTDAMFPYRGVDAEGRSHTGIEQFNLDPENTTLATIAGWRHTTVEDYKKVVEAEAAAEGKTYEEKLVELEAVVKQDFEESPGYSFFDDWTIPATNAEGRSNRTLTPLLTLKDGNVLPAYWNDGDGANPNADSIEAMKQEIVNGHAVSIAYASDKATPGQTANTRYMNRENWAQYTFEPARFDHAVCIVGWDDNYPAGNFTHEVAGVDPALTTPPADGAWIVKNSWGSETDVTTDELGNEVGFSKYGVRDADGKATGYFYLSYYDKSIAQPETMTFSASLLGDAGSFGVLQHDYMAAQYGFYTEKGSKKEESGKIVSDIVSSANVFEAPQDITLNAVSTRTSEENQRVTFAIYEMKDDATNPADGTLLYRTSCNFEYSGFHRLDLETPLTVPAGKKVSVISTVSAIDSDGSRTYSVSANQGIGIKLIEEVWKVPYDLYSTAVVNKGESFLYSDGKWVDWSEHIAAIMDEQLHEPIIDYLPIDNFSIKVYTEPAAKSVVKEDITEATVTVASAKYNGGKAVEPKVTVKLGETTLKSATDYTVSYVNNKNAGSAVAVVKGTGSYTGSATKAFTIAKAANTMTAKAKTKMNKVKWSKVKRSDQVIAKAKAFTVSKAKGTVTFKKASGNKKISVSKAGKVTVKKGLAKGTYTVKVKVTAAGNANYKQGVKTVTLKVKVA